MSEQRSYSPSAVVHEGTSKALLVVIAFMAGAALVSSLWAINEARKAEREARVLQIKVEGFENAMHKHGLDPAPHLPGQGD